MRLGGIEEQIQSKGDDRNYGSEYHRFREAFGDSCSGHQCDHDSNDDGNLFHAVTQECY
jgi:hypothetical protein